MPSHIAILPSKLSDQAGSAGIGTARLAQAYGRLPPAALMLLAVISVELSWALATVVLSDVGQAGTAWLSTAFAATVFTLISTPKLDGRLRKHWFLVVLFGLTDAGMTLPFLLSLQHGIPLGIASAIAFLGPLGLAVATSRRLVHFLWIGIAALGVALLTPAIGQDLSMAGLGFAAVSAVAWAAFVPATKLVGRAFGGRDGLTLGLWALSLMLLPFALAEGTVLQADAFNVAGVLLVALLGAVLPWAIEFSVIQRISARTYGILVTLEPAVGALVGAIFLSQSIGPRMWIAVACVTVAAMGVTLSEKQDE
ncbi:MAG TPA: EamA family transporter [Dongiaceae bacterium]|jgi:inner membrane transporter RhtA|nr:EamA family transporter [Dongiaceae bacterium]